jgi:transcriptional regulator with GAF, ATPase, and Fis domain
MMDSNIYLNQGNGELKDLVAGIPLIHSKSLSALDNQGEIIDMIDDMRDANGRRRATRAAGTALGDRSALKEEHYDQIIAPCGEVDGCSVFEGVVGKSTALQSTLKHVAKVAATDSTVLITGETGTGKELIARAIHNRSRRSSRAFVGVNCASIPSSLVASELFGHEKGSFTGALQQRQGRFELAQGGTIFLDEVGELPAETQVMLLRVIQERQFERVGGNRPITADVRVIAATNRDLTAAIHAGTFRSDLFYRLNVFPIHVPPLRSRKDDIPMLVEYFVKRVSQKMGKHIRGIDRKALDLCHRYDWPGNIRELQNIVERFLILSESDIFSIDESWMLMEKQSGVAWSGPLREALLDQERKIIEAALVASEGKISGQNGAAARLGIPPSTLDSKIKHFGIRKNQLTSPY